MREVTGDPTIRFHHLRHSFASWLFLALELAQFEDIPELFPHLPETTKFLCKARDLKISLYRHNENTRKNLFLVASLLGHSGPDISLEHYVHFCDVLLTLFLENNNKSLTKTNLIKISGLDKVAAYRWYNKEGMSGILKAIRKRHPERFNILAADENARPDVVGPNIDNILTESYIGRIKNLHKLLFLYSARNMNLQDLAHRCEFTLDQASRIISQAKYISSMKGSNNKNIYHHDMMMYVKDKKEPNNKTRLICPIEPRQKCDKSVVTTFFPKLIQMVEKERGKTFEVLDYYIHNAWKKRNELVFHNPDEPDMAIKYLEFLQSLGIQKKDIVFTVYTRNQRSSFTAKWRKQLALSKRVQIQRIAPTNSDSPATEQWLGIKPVFDISHANEKQGSYGFRYMMLMTNIYAAVLFPIDNVTNLKSAGARHKGNPADQSRSLPGSEAASV